MVEYHCRKCHRFLFESDAVSGRLRVTCHYRDCKTAQMVFLGGHFKERRVGLQVVPRADGGQEVATR